MLPQPLNRSREKLIARIRMPFGGALLEPLMGLGDLERLWTRTLREEASGCIFDALLRTLKVRCTMEPSDADKIPSSGPVAIVANHPCGLLEGPAIASVVYQRRKDIRFLANSIPRRFRNCDPTSSQSRSSARRETASKTHRRCSRRTAGCATAEC